MQELNEDALLLIGNICIRGVNELNDVGSDRLHHRILTTKLNATSIHDNRRAFFHVDIQLNHNELLDDVLNVDVEIRNNEFGARSVDLASVSGEWVADGHDEHVVTSCARIDDVEVGGVERAAGDVFGWVIRQQLNLGTIFARESEIGEKKTRSC